MTRYVKGFPSRIYIKDPSTRNEALDLRVYAYTALIALNVHWGALLANTFGPTVKIERTDHDDEEEAPTPPQTRHKRRRRSKPITPR